MKKTKLMALLLAASMALCLGLVAYEWCCMIQSARRWAPVGGGGMAAGGHCAAPAGAVPAGGGGTARRGAPGGVVAAP